MKAELRLPENFTELQTKESMYSNIADEIKESLRDEIYQKPFFARYAAWGYNGIVWWNDKIGYWCMEIWKYHKYETTHIAETIEELIKEVKEIHGGK